MNNQILKEYEKLWFSMATHDDEIIKQTIQEFRQAMAQQTTANDTQIGGDHYKAKPIQPWDFIAANQLGYFEGNIVKYVSRWKDKGGINDLKKARHYLDKLIELEDNQP
jgi:hypothetical protein